MFSVNCLMAKPQMFIKSQNSKSLSNDLSTVSSNKTIKINKDYDIPYIIKYLKKDKYEAHNIAISVSNLAKNIVTKPRKYRNMSFKEYANALRKEYSQTIQLIKDNTYLYPLLMKYIGVDNLRKAGLLNASSHLCKLLYEELKMMPDNDEYDTQYLRNAFSEYLKELNITNNRDIEDIMLFMFGGKSNLLLEENEKNKNLQKIFLRFY